MDKRVLDFYCECDGKTLEGFKQRSGVGMGFLFKDPFSYYVEKRQEGTIMEERKSGSYFRSASERW